MINVQLPTGKTISVTVYEYLFVLKEDEIDLFFQSCIADDLGVEINDPFADRSVKGRLIFEDDSNIPELPEAPDDIDV